jgi:hypothetical protein
VSKTQKCSIKEISKKIKRLVKDLLYFKMERFTRGTGKMDDDMDLDYVNLKMVGCIRGNGRTTHQRVEAHS